MTELAKHSFPQAKAWQSLLGAFTRDIKILCDEELVTDLGNEVKTERGGSVAHRLLATECKAQWSVKASAESVMYERTLPNMASYAMEWTIANLPGAKNEMCWAPKHTYSWFWSQEYLVPSLMQHSYAAKWDTVIKYHVNSEIRNLKFPKIFLPED